MAQTASRLAKANLLTPQLLKGAGGVPVVIIGTVPVRRKAPAPPGLLTVPAKGVGVRSPDAEVLLMHRSGTQAALFCPKCDALQRKKCARLPTCPAHKRLPRR
jgi:hypothetical protein